MITARGLVQTFHTGQGKNKKDVHAVDGVDLDVAEGEVVGFLGPNGAGKTTTLRMLVTLLRRRPAPPRSPATTSSRTRCRCAARIGYVSQAGSTFSGARAGDEVVDHGMLYGMSKAEAVRRGQQLFDAAAARRPVASGCRRPCRVARSAGSTSRWG